MLYLHFTLAHISSYFASGHHIVFLQRSQTILVLLVANTIHRQTYKQQIKATKNSTAHKVKRRTKREPIATVSRTQEMPKTELRLKRNDYRKFILYKRKAYNYKLDLFQLNKNMEDSLVQIGQIIFILRTELKLTIILFYKCSHIIY